MRTSHFEFLSNICNRELYGYQLELFQHDNLVADTSRAIGFSYLAALKIAYLMCTQENVKIAYIVPHSTNNIILDVVKIIEGFPEELKREFLIKNKQFLRCSNSNTLEILCLRNGEKFRGKSITHLYITEFDSCNIDTDEFLYLYYIQNIHKECNLWAWGLSNNGKLDELKSKVKSGQFGSRFRFYHLPWYVVPERGISWMDKVKDSVGEEHFNHEYLGKWDTYGSY